MDKANEAKEDEVNNYCVANSSKAYKTDVANEANNVFVKANGASVASNIVEAKEADKLPLFIGARMMCILPLVLLFSLKKYYPIFTDVKGCFRINNNQLEGL
jgi:hypothetical protein